MSGYQVSISVEALNAAVEEAICRNPPKELADLVGRALAGEIESGAFDKAIKAAVKKEIKERLPYIVSDVLDQDDEVYRVIREKVLNALR